MGLIRILILPVLLTLLSCGCVSTNYNLATNRQEYTMTSTEKEVNMGRKLAKKVNSEIGLVQDNKMQERVSRIGKRLVEVCDRKEIVYSFSAVKGDEVNAFSLPGGYVFVNEGLIKKTHSDDELAAVLAHEIAHVAARHSVKRFESGIGAQILEIATIAAGRKTSLTQGVGMASLATQLAYSREDELAADRLGVRYMEKAGFDPKAMLTFLEMMEEQEQYKRDYIPEGITRPRNASTHPFWSDRIKAVKEEIFGVADYVDYLNTTNN